MLPIVMSIVNGLIANNMPKVADAVIEKGVDYVQEKMGITLKPEHEATKEDYEKWNAEAAKHEEFMAELDLKNMEGARNMQLAAMQSEDPLVRRFAYYFMGSWSLFAMVVIPCLIWVPIPDSQMRFADAFQGFLLGTIVAGMFQFLLGSSLGSRNKDKK
jgi:MoaA/NifB/PqqE/SkfB family radical SAM enzyme